MLSAFRSRPFRRFWVGALVANLGMWIQQIALGWYVYTLTRSASWLGAISFAGNLPTFLVGLLAGAIADRTSRRTIMVATLLVLSVSASALALLTAMGVLTVWHVIALAMLAGTASALYTPAMHSALPSLVGPDDLMHAISLNSLQFNLARTLGPAVAGLLYGAIGPAGCFLLNALGFLAQAAVTARLDLPHQPAAAPLPVGRALREGLRYVRGHAVIGPALAVAAVLSGFGFPYIVLLPAVARDVLHLDASGMGLLMAAVGAGAVVGAIGLSTLGNVPEKALVSLVAALLFACGLSAFAVVRSVHAMLGLLFCMGGLQTISVASLTTTIQMTVHDGMRGRVMSMLTVMFFGLSTSGGLVLGTIGDRVGVPNALAGGAVVVMAAVLLALARVPALRQPVHLPR